MKYIKIALIPAYEPNNNLIKLVRELWNQKYSIIIVNDGSGSNFKHVFSKCSKYANIISYDINKGKGYALKRGLEYIKENYKEPYIIITMDSDGQHTIKDASKLIKECEKKDNTLYLGKRIRSSKTPIKSLIGNCITRFIYKLTTGLDIYDTQTGLRAFSNKLVDYLLDIEGNRFEYEMNVLLKCAKDKVKMKEIEITTIYEDNNSGTHFNWVKDSYRIYKDILKYSLNKNGRK